MLVDYSDSEDEEAAAPAAATEPALPAAAPPAKRAKKEINLQSLLQRHDASLPFEEAGKLPADFFDSERVREPDAGEDDAPQAAMRGWAALSSLLLVIRAMMSGAIASSSKNGPVQSLKALACQVMKST